MIKYEEFSKQSLNYQEKVDKCLEVILKEHPEYTLSYTQDVNIDFGIDYIIFSCFFDWRKSDDRGVYYTQEEFRSFSIHRDVANKTLEDWIEHLKSTRQFGKGL